MGTPWQVGGHTHKCVHALTDTATLCAYAASLTQGGLPPWNALTFSPFRRKVFKQMLLQKKKNVAALWATALLSPNFHKKKKGGEGEHA